MSGLAGELVTVRDWLRHAATRFGRAPLYYGHGTDNAWDEAVALVADALRLPRDRLESLLDARLPASERDSLAELVERRVVERVPVPYLTGIAWLAGVSFEIDERVIVPRSPIASLLETGLQPWLGERTPRRILDLCCGSGCLGLLAALALEDSEVVLADVDPAALEIAARNVARHDVADRVDCVASDGLAALDGRFDLILCNPPYVDAADLATMPAEFAHEPRIALDGNVDGGADGLDLVARLIDALPAHLTEDGLFVLEVGNSAPALVDRFPRLPWLWPELDAGGVGVALLEARDLIEGT